MLLQLLSANIFSLCVEHRYSSFQVPFQSPYLQDLASEVGKQLFLAGLNAEHFEYSQYTCPQSKKLYRCFYTQFLSYFYKIVIYSLISYT